MFVLIDTTLHLMDFKNRLQYKLSTTFSCIEIAKDCFFIEHQEHNLAILYYRNGAERMLNTSQNENVSQFSYRTESLRTATQSRENFYSQKSLIHIDEDLWISKPQILLDRLATLYGHAEKSNARQAVVARIDKKVAMEFQEEHHLQGALTGKYRYGLFKDGELLAVAIFSGLRNMRHTENYRSIELLHFCQKAKHLVIGGFSKILNKMVQDFSPNDIMTYIDRDWSEGHKFVALGFEQKGGIPSLCFKVNKATHERSLFRENEETLNPDEYYLVKTLGSIKMVKLNHQLKD